MSAKKRGGRVVSDEISLGTAHQRGLMQFVVPPTRNILSFRGGSRGEKLMSDVGIRQLRRRRRSGVDERRRRRNLYDSDGRKGGNSLIRGDIDREIKREEDGQNRPRNG